MVDGEPALGVERLLRAVGELQGGAWLRITVVPGLLEIALVPVGLARIGRRLGRIVLIGMRLIGILLIGVLLFGISLLRIWLSAGALRSE